MTSIKSPWKPSLDRYSSVDRETLGKYKEALRFGDVNSNLEIKCKREN